MTNVELPPGLQVTVAAAPPLLRHPIMGCLDDRGRMFIGDAAGLNLDRQALEQQLPNRVLMLEDRNGDGVYDTTNVFADKLTFPAGGVWLDGSLYVAAPPGLWKMTDTNADGVADRRELVLDGFEFHTGNGTQIHGPFLHPTNGRLFFCGNQRATVKQKDGTLVRDGRATGVWSCNPDGSEVEWHSLGGMANAVEVDFTPEGEVVGVVNIHFQQPRGDTLIHWLYGGVYERADGRVRNSTLADLPHTIDHMPIHNFGHVAVSGFLRYRSGALNPAWKDNLFVTFFNTQKLVRAELAATGASYKVVEHEFFKLNDPDAHFTDVIEDADGSLLVLDTGGWFRRGCPSSLSSKPDLRGAVYRIQKRDRKRLDDPYGEKINWASLSPAELTRLQTDARWKVRERATWLAADKRPMVVTARDILDASRPHARLRALEQLARTRKADAAQGKAVFEMLAQSLEPALEHAAMFAAIATKAFTADTVRSAASAVRTRRLLLVLEQTATEPAAQDAVLLLAKAHFESSDLELARAAVGIASRNPRAAELCSEDFLARLAHKDAGPAAGQVVVDVMAPHLARPAAQHLISAMLDHPAQLVRHAAWKAIARQPGNVSNPAWIPSLEKSLGRLASEGGAELQLLLDAVSKLQTKHFDGALQGIMKDPQRPAPVRLKALAAMARPNQPLAAEAFDWLLEILQSGTSTAARVDAARLLTRARLSKEQLRAVAPVLAKAGPVELTELLADMRKKIDPDTARLWAQHFARSAVFSSYEESVIRSSFQALSSTVYEEILGPATRAAAAANDAKKRKLEALAANARNGRVAEGRKVFEASTCVACHKAGNTGRAMGPDLSRIGQIRQPRDLLESILFPSATVAQDFETHVIETANGQTHTGTLKNETTDALILLDLAGQEKSVPLAEVVGRNTLTTSLMPTGLEQAFTDQQLLDLVAWLGSLK